MGKGQVAAIRLRVAILATIGLALLCSSAALARDITWDSLSQRLNFERQSYKAVVAASCSLKNHAPVAMAFFSGIQPGDRFASYMNPTNCAGSPDYPYSIYFVSFPLFHLAAVNWPVGVELEFWSVKRGDSCAGPDELLYSKHFLLDSVSFMAPKVGVLKLPDPVCVRGPFFVSVHYDASTPPPYPSVLFDTLVPPQPCLNWGYHDGWLEWTQFWTGPIAGNTIIWVDGYSNSSYCQTNENTTLTIESTHDQADTLEGSRVSLLGYYTGSGDGKFVSRYTDYLRNEPLPPKSEIIISGPPPDDSLLGCYSQITGYIMAEKDPRPLYSSDSLTLRVFPSQVTKLISGPSGPALGAPSLASNNFATPEAVCDSCRFAVIVAGGGNEANNHARYWNELRSLYEYETTSGGYCPGSVFALYYDGFSRDLLQVPQNVLDSCTPGRLHARLDDLSHRVAVCARKGKSASLELLTTALGKSTGLMTIRDSLVTGPQLRAWLQLSIDSSLQTLHLQMAQAFGGPVADSLKFLNDARKTSIHVASAGGSAPSWSAPTASRLLTSQITALQAGASYDLAAAVSADSYLHWLDSLRTSYDGWASQIKSWLQSHPPLAGDSIRPKLVQDSLALRQNVSEIASVLATSNKRPDIWTRKQLHKFCEWQQIAVPSNGQFSLQASGDTTVSGSVTVYKDTVIGGNPSKVKAAIWHWNIPGSAGYVLGNNKRVLNGAASSPTSFWLHDDNLEFTATVSELSDKPTAESSSNPYAFPGFSLGGTDKVNGEFGLGGSGSVALLNVELPGLALSSVPGTWGACGFSQVVAQYSIPFLTTWHSAMEFRLEIAQVTTPGTIAFTVTGAQHPSGNFNITTPGTYRFDCGAFSLTGPNSITINISTGCFGIDSWALRSTKLDPPNCCVGTTGNVNASGIVDLADLSLLISYLLGSSVTLPCPAEANVNGLGLIDLSDLSTLIAYLVNGTGPLPNCP